MRIAVCMHLYYTEMFHEISAYLDQIALSDYDVILKVHSKKDIPTEFLRNGVDLSGTKWRDYMFRALLGMPERVRDILRIMERHPPIGMVCAEEVFLQGAEQIAQDIDLGKVEALMIECGMSILRWEYVAGSIFAVHPQLLAPLKRCKFSAEDFPPYFPRDGNGLPYCLERVFGCMVSA